MRHTSVTIFSQDRSDSRGLHFCWPRQPSLKKKAAQRDKQAGKEMRGREQAVPPADPQEPGQLRRTFRAPPGSCRREEGRPDDHVHSAERQKMVVDLGQWQARAEAQIIASMTAQMPDTVKQSVMSLLTPIQSDILSQSRPAVHRQDSGTIATGGASIDSRPRGSTDEGEIIGGVSHVPRQR